MATVLTIIQSAFRRSGAISAGHNLNAVNRDVGLERLQTIYKDMAAGGLFGRLTDNYLPDSSAYEAKEFERVVNSHAATVTFPTTVDDGCDIRTPREAALIQVVVPGTGPTTYVYDSAMGAWTAIESLTVDSQAPLSAMYQDALTDLLAVLIADDTGIQISPVLAKRASAARLKLASRYGSARSDVAAEYY